MAAGPDGRADGTWPVWLHTLFWLALLGVAFPRLLGHLARMLLGLG